MTQSVPLVYDRFTLGTAQIGLPYGRRKDAGLMDQTSVDRLLDYAWERGIRRFDTAEAYGVAASRLATWLTRRTRMSEAHVCTKIQIKVPADGSAASAALNRFRGARSRALLAHSFVSGEAWEQLVAAADRADAVCGQSVYGGEEVARAAAMGAERVQVAANVLDEAAFAARAERPTALDLRSVFLQGVLLDDPTIAERRVESGGVAAQAVQTAARDLGEPAASLLVAAVLAKCRPGDALVVGADVPADLDDSLAGAAIGSDQANAFRELVLEGLGGPASPRLLDPRQW